MMTKEIIEHLRTVFTDNNFYKNATDSNYLLNSDLDIVESYLEVLEIIKNKYVNLYYFKSCLKYPHPHETYNMGERTLTAREFDMLKEWLENDPN